MRLKKIWPVIMTGNLLSVICSPAPGDFTAQESPPLGICHPRQKNANARGSAWGGWAQVELTDALVQNKIILQSETLNLFQNKPCNLFIPFPKYQYLEVIMKSV